MWCLWLSSPVRSEVGTPLSSQTPRNVRRPLYDWWLHHISNSNGYLPQISLPSVQIDPIAAPAARSLVVRAQTLAVDPPAPKTAMRSTQGNAYKQIQ